MAVNKTITHTDTSITITLYGFSNVAAGSKFYYYLSDTHGGSESYSMPVTKAGTSFTYTMSGLDPGENYYLSVELVTAAGKEYSYPSSGSYDYTDEVFTTGTSPRDMSGVYSNFNESGTGIQMSLSSLPKYGHDRYLTMWVYKNGTLLDYEDATILSSRTYAYPYIYGLEEQTSYEVEALLFFYPWGQETEETIAHWERQAKKTTYAEGGELSVSNVTENGCMLAVEDVPGNYKYPRTLQWYGRQGTSGAWELLTTTTATSSARQTHSINTLLPKTYYEFKVEVYVGSTHIETIASVYSNGQSMPISCTTAEAAGTLSSSDITEYSAKLTLSGLKTGVSYVRKIKWYYKAASDSGYTQFTNTSTVSQSSNSTAVVLDCLASDTAYSFKAEICDNSGKVLGTKTTTGTTLPTAAEISIGDTTSASVKVVVSGLANVAYARSFEWWYKRQSEPDYQMFDKTELSPSDTSGETTKTFKPLTPNTYYDFKVTILKDTTPMKLLTISGRTALDNSLVPDTEIIDVVQEIGSTKVKVYWDAPNHVTGAYYKVQYSTDDENYIDASTVFTQPPADGSYTEITLPELDKDYYIQIMSYFQVEDEIASKFTTPSFEVYTFSVLEWQTEIVSGKKFNIPADEWNKIIRVVRERLEKEDVVVDEIIMDPAVKGKPFTAKQFNQVLYAVNIFNPHDIEDVSPGDAITAELLNKLLTKINLL
jgi:hypothetical protein